MKNMHNRQQAITTKVPDGWNTQTGKETQEILTESILQVQK
jgi:hypothetical protein